MISLRKPCAVCLRRHGRMSPRPWPLPLHPHCECEQWESRPVPEAPLFRRHARSDAAAQRSRSGPGWWACRAGGWSRPAWWAGRTCSTVMARSRDFDLVVRSKGLTVAQLLGAGIPEAIARRAVGLGPMGK